MRFVSPSAHLPGLPPYPSWELVAPAQIPAPPRVAIDDAAAIKQLADAYRGAVEWRFPGQRCFVLAKRTAAQDKALLIAARALAERDIPPTSWAAFSCDVWAAATSGETKNVPGKRWPPVAWVFGAKRITEREDWFHSEAADYAGGRAVYGPKHRDLIARYLAMRGRVAHLLDLSRERLEALGKATFPEGFDRLVGEVREEARLTQEHLARRIARGEWVWHH